MACVRRSCVRAGNELITRMAPIIKHLSCESIKFSYVCMLSEIVSAQRLLSPAPARGQRNDEEIEGRWSVVLQEFEFISKIHKKPARFCLSTLSWTHRAPKAY